MQGQLKNLGSRAIIGAFMKRLEEQQRAGWTSQLALQLDSNQEVETIEFLGDAPAMMEHIGGPRPVSTVRPYEFTIRNKEFSGGLRFKESDVRRDKTGQIMIRAKELGARAAQLPQKVLSKLLVDNGNAYDGVAFYHATNHKNANNDTIANAIQIAAATGVIPTNAETETGLLTGIETILGFKDDAGEPRNEFAKDFVVMVPTALWKQVKAVLKNDFIASGVSNSLKATDFTITPIMNPRLAAPFLYIFRTDSDVKSLVWQDEVLPHMDVLAEGSEYAKLNWEHIYLAKRIGNGGYGRFDQTVRVEFT
jgi:phage major head subunit gpT-like protein